MVGGDTEDYVNSEIVCTLAALGYLEDGIYFKGDDCLGELLIIDALKIQGVGFISLLF